MTQLQAFTTEKKDIDISSPTKKTVQECPVGIAIDVIGGKWKVIILYQLQGETLRFSELKARIPDISQKMLSRQLKELENDMLISRKAYAEVPPRVEYTPTELANKLNPALVMLCEWGGELLKAKQAQR